MRLAQPEYLLLLLPVLAALGLLALHTRRQRYVLRVYAGVPRFPRRLVLKRGLLAGGLALAVLAGTQPQVMYLAESQDVTERQVLYLLDISRSMLVNDARPNRLEQAKGLIRQLSAKLLGEPQGLIVFADYAFMQCPMTQDPGAFGTLLSVATPQQFANHGTDLRNGLLMASRVYEELPTGAYSRVAILLTDGEDFGENYTSAIARLKRQGVNVFVVGVGTATGGGVPALGDTAAPPSNALSRLNREGLAQLATEMGTPALYLADTLQDTETLANQILGLPPSAVAGQPTQERWIETYQIPLGFGFVLLMLGLLLPFVPKPKTD